MAVGFGLMAGHFGWMVVGTIYLHAWQKLGTELALYAGIIFVFIGSPGTAAVVITTIYQSLYALAHVGVLQALDSGSPEFKALLIHLYFRVSVIVAIWAGLGGREVLRRLEEQNRRATDSRPVGSFFSDEANRSDLVQDGQRSIPILVLICGTALLIATIFQVAKLL
jgi:hypothetical protein